MFEKLKGIKFEKSGYPVFKTAFWIFIICSIAVIFNILRVNKYNFSIIGFDYPLKPISINLTLKKQAEDVVLLCFGGYCKMPVNTSLIPLEDKINIYSVQLNEEDENFFKSKVKTLSLAYPADNKDILKNIERVDVYIGDDKYHYNYDDLLKMEQKKIQIYINEEKKGQDFNIITINNNINNYKGIATHLTILLLSLFCYWSVFIIPYCWLLIAFLIYYFVDKEVIIPEKFKNINRKWLLGAVILGGIFVRLSNINYHQLWWDEIYTKTIAIKSFASCFQDAGNPPLFYILELFMSKLGFSGEFGLRFLPFIFSILFIYVAYLFFKKIDKNLAIFASFLAAFNLINILASQSARSYTLCVFLGIFSTYYLFKYLNNPKIKNLAIYTLIAICAINTHYILAIFMFVNFIWGIADLFENKNKKEIIKFTLSNIIAFLTFVPYLLINLSKACSETFNLWIPKLSKDVFLSVVNQFFVNKTVFLIVSSIVLIMLIVCYLSKKIKDKLKVNPLKENLLIYLVYSIALTIIISCIISVFVKPIFNYRVILSIYSCIFMLEVTVISTIFDFKKITFKPLHFTKIIYSFLLILLYFYVTLPLDYAKNFRLDDFMDFVNIDSKKYQNYDIHIISFDEKEYLKYYPEFNTLNNINWYYVKLNKGEHLDRIRKKEFVKNNPQTVVYFNNLAVDFSTASIFNPTMKIYPTNSIKIGKIVFNKEVE